MAEEFTISLSHDQALVLSPWLNEVMGIPEFATIVNGDPAVWSPLHRIAGNLDKAIPDIVAPDYTHRLAAARERLRAALGDLGRPAADD
jgi:hypothetical protein